ncbi:MAG: hypothetical protein VX341_12055 [Bdellovibrionota bacterium]|nr:hypothetical protein [Bdellovibrionota bacterium]
MFKTRDSFNIILSRLFLGTLFFISGLSGFVEIDALGLFSVENSQLAVVSITPHYYALKGIEILIGLTFIANFYVQTSLILATPILLSALGLHVWQGSSVMFLTIIALLPLINLFVFYKDTFALFFKPQAYTNHMAEETPRVLTYNEVREKTPGLEKKFEEIYKKVSNA